MNGGGGQCGHLMVRSLVIRKSKRSPIHGVAVCPRPEEMRDVYKHPVEFRPVKFRDGCSTLPLCHGTVGFRSLILTT